MRRTHIHAIGTAVPRYRGSQAEVAEWVKRVAAGQRTGDDDESLKETRRLQGAIDRVYRGSAIERRSSVVADFALDACDFTFFPPDWSLDPSPSTASRMELYRREAPGLARAAVSRALEAAPHVPVRSITHLVVVSCTGFFAPGLDTILAKELGLRRDVERLQIGFMGCYATFPALRQAHAICQSDPEAVVLVVAVELCTIHFQRELSMQQIVANCLFSDGAGAAILSSEPEGSSRGLAAIVDSRSHLADDSEEQMTWTVTDTGFRMTLTAEVPETIRDGIEGFVDGLLAPNGVARDEVGIWAVHPGGRRIVEATREQLGLTAEDVAASYEVLAENGNMSSPTILFVLEQVFARGPKAGERGVALAFGPGLTFESLLFETL